MRRTPAPASARVTLALTLTVLFPGCSSTPDEPPTDPALDALAESAERVQGELSQLRALEQEQSNKPNRSYDAPTRGPLSEPITLNWSGPVEPVLEAVTDMLDGYDYTVSGDTPTQAITVDIDANNEPAWNVLRDIGRQTGNRVGVHINDRDQIVELTYEGRGNPE